jgi:cell division protein FtsB
MDSQFYRNLEPKRLLRDISKKAAKNKRRTVIIVIAIIVALYLAFDNKGIISRVRLEMQKEEMVEKVNADSLETKKLQSQIKALEGDKKTIETVARERHGMARKGETVYRTKKEE